MNWGWGEYYEQSGAYVVTGGRGGEGRGEPIDAHRIEPAV